MTKKVKLSMGPSTMHIAVQALKLSYHISQPDSIEELRNWPMVELARSMALIWERKWIEGCAAGETKYKATLGLSKAATLYYCLELYYQQEPHQLCQLAMRQLQIDVFR